jgi:hypothetical protein
MCSIYISLPLSCSGKIADRLIIPSLFINPLCRPIMRASKKRNNNEKKPDAVFCCCVTQTSALSSSIIISKKANETFCGAKCLRDAERARVLCRRRNCKLRIKSRTAPQRRALSHFCFSTLAPTHHHQS